MLLGAQERRQVKSVCSNCMKNWKENGKKPEKKPKPILISDLKDNKCPTCGENFRIYFPF